MPTYAITMLAAGIGISIPAAMNAALGRSYLHLAFSHYWWWL
tara:strand:+ start:251 stop:376 length:126 start_codon:yes stop_codon:yes gene_type:complete